MKYMSLVEFIEKAKENKVFPGYIKVYCATEGCNNFWGVSPQIIDGELVVPVTSQYCGKCAINEKTSK